MSPSCPSIVDTVMARMNWAKESASNRAAIALTARYPRSAAAYEKITPEAAAPMCSRTNRPPGGPASAPRDRAGSPSPFIARHESYTPGGPLPRCNRGSGVIDASHIGDHDRPVRASCSRREALTAARPSQCRLSSAWSW